MTGSNPGLVIVWNNFQVESKLDFAEFLKGHVHVQYSNNKIYAVGKNITSAFVIMDTKLNIIKQVNAAELGFTPLREGCHICKTFYRSL